MARVVIFGLKDMASLAHFYFKSETAHEVVAFTVTEDYLPAERTFEGKPVVSFEKVQDLYPPDDFAFFAPMSYARMNKLRQDIYRQAKAKHYRCLSYISSRAILYPETPIGDNCMIGAGCVIQPFTTIGNNVIVSGGSFVGHHNTVGDHVFYAPHAVTLGHCSIGPNCVAGANSTLRECCTLAEGTFVAMAACVTRDTEPWSIYRGNPARKVEGVASDSLER